MTSEMQERIARAIYEGRNGAKCKPWAHQPAAHREPYLSDALAAMKAMREPTEKHRQSCELGAKVRKVAAQLSVERFNGWANPLVSDLVDAADFLEGKTPMNESSEAVLSADAEISRRRGARMTDIDTKALALRVADWLDCLSAGTTEICDLAPAEARTISRVLREAAEGTRYFLSTDNDSHWHLVPVARISEWEEWSAIPEDDERAWDAPEFATPLGGAPCLVTFAAPHLNGRPLPPPPSEAATLSQETRNDD